LSDRWRWNAGHTLFSKALAVHALLRGGGQTQPLGPGIMRGDYGLRDGQKWHGEAFLELLGLGCSPLKARVVRLARQFCTSPLAERAGLLGTWA
jgi:hypothetical protein